MKEQAALKAIAEVKILQTGGDETVEVYRFPRLWWECPGKAAARAHANGAIMGKAWQERARLHNNEPSNCPCKGTDYVLIEGDGERVLGLLRLAKEQGWATIFLEDGTVVISTPEDEYSGASQAVALAKALGILDV